MVSQREVSDQVLHAALPHPLLVRELVTQVLDHLGIETPAERVSVNHAFAIMRAVGIRESQVASVAADCWLDASRIWSAAGIEPPEAGGH